MNSAMALRVAALVMAAALLGTANAQEITLNGSTLFNLYQGALVTTVLNDPTGPSSCTLGFMNSCSNITGTINNITIDSDPPLTVYPAVGAAKGSSNTTCYIVNVLLGDPRVFAVACVEGNGPVPTLGFGGFVNFCDSTLYSFCASAGSSSGAGHIMLPKKHDLAA